MTVDQAAAVDRAAARLSNAARTRTPCAPVRDLLPAGSTAIGYAVQSVLTRERLDGGRRIVGRKIGLTSPAVQAQLGVDQPDFGVLFDDMWSPLGDIVDSTRLLQPRIEAEVAFVLARDLDAPQLDAESARAAVDHVVPALEIVDSRIAGWDITFVDTVADNASSGMFVLGSDTTPYRDLDLRAVRMTLVDGAGQTVSSGSGAAC